MILKAGFARQDITPRVGVELYGFGPYLRRYSIGVRAPLEARAAVFELDGKRIAIVGCDICTLPEFMVERIREQVALQHPELLPDGLLITASHTHSGPAVHLEDAGWGAPDFPYLNLLPAKIANAVCQAAEHLEEVMLSVASAPCAHIGLNRVFDKDAPPLEDVLKEDWTPAKPELTDTACQVLRFDSATRKMKGFMAYFGCHPVVCCQQTRYIHGDYAGLAMQQLMREFPGSVGIFLQGAEGDVNAGCVHKPEQESLLALDIFASRFANSVRTGLQRAIPADVTVLRRARKRCRFTTRESFTEEHLMQLKEKFSEAFRDPNAQDSDGTLRMNTVYLRGIAKMLDTLRSGNKTVDAEVSALRLGPVKFLGAPFEIMQGIKNDVVKQVACGLPLVLSLCNGACGYAPSREVAQVDMDKAHQGGYEATKVPLMQGRLPYGDIHGELLNALLELDRELEK